MQKLEAFLMIHLTLQASPPPLPLKPLLLYHHRSLHLNTLREAELCIVTIEYPECQEDVAWYGLDLHRC